MHNSKRIILALVIVLILGVYWYYLHKADVPAASKHQKPTAILTAKSKQNVLPNRVHTLGTVHMQRQLNVYSPVSGKVISVRVKPKEYVKKNAILIQVGAASYREKITEADKNKQGMSVTSVRAPISGYIKNLSVQVGDTVKEANLTAIIIDHDNVVVKYLLPGKYSDAVKRGQKIIVKRIYRSSKETTPGIVIKVDRSGTKYVRDIHVTASLPKPQISLQPGLIVSVTQVLDHS